MTKVTINHEHLIAVNHAASNEETRYYLQGVHVEFLPDRTIYVATDGNVLLASSHEAVNPAGIAPIIIHRDSIKPIKLEKHVPDHGYDYEIIDGADGAIYGKLIGKDRILKTINGKFPDWRRILPAVVSHEPAFIDPSKLEIFSKICRNKAISIATLDTPHVLQNGSDVAFVLMGSEREIFGLVMPLRDKIGASEITKPVPDWCSVTPASNKIAAE